MRKYLLGLGALALLGTAAAAKDLSPSEFVAKAGASDTFEIDSAKLMVGSKNPAISRFATQMISDHAKSTKQVGAAARLDGITPGKPPSLSIGQRTNLTTLKAVPSGKTKDDLYVKQQKASHADALALMQDYAAGGSARHLKATAGKIVPVVEQHQTMLAGM